MPLRAKRDFPAGFCENGEMGIISRVFRPKEVKDVLYALNSLDTTFEGFFLYQGVKNAVRSMIIDHPDQTKNSILLERLAPIELALLLIRKHCFDEVGSGFNHVYRGRLTGNGHALRKIYAHAMAELVAKKFLTQAEAQETDETLRQDIAAAG